MRFCLAFRLVIAVVLISMLAADGESQFPGAHRYSRGTRGVDAYCGVMGQQLLSQNPLPALEALSVYWPL